MGIRYENQCDGCESAGYPCLGRSCEKKRVPIPFCDRCKEDIDGDIYESDDEELCEECLKAKHRRKE